MNLLRNFIGFAAMAVVLFACKKELSEEDGKLPGSSDAQWEFLESGTLYSGQMDSGYVQTISGFNTLTLLGSGSGDQDGQIVLQISAPSIEATSYSNPQIFFQYTENGSTVYQNSPLQAEGLTITITEIDSTSITGTFSGTVQDSAGNPKIITEGKFTASVSSEEPSLPDPDQTGTLTVWTKQLCTGGTPVEIILNEYTGQVTAGLSAQPQCGAAGTANFELPAGRYLVSAVCGGDTLTYEVSIVSNTCNVLEVDFGPPLLFEHYLPTTLGSSWEYTDVEDASRKHTVTVDGEEDLDGRTYKRFTSSLPEQRYFRMEGHNYFEYVSLNFGGVVTEGPSIDLEILRDDAPQNTSWETPAYDVKLSEMPVTLKLVMTIIQRDFSANINGKTYRNLIQVNTELMVAGRGRTDFQAFGSYATVFSKGVGIVYYYDPSAETEWGLSNYTLVP